MVDLVSLDHKLLDILLCERAYDAFKASLASKGMTIYSAIIFLHKGSSPEGVIAIVLDSVREAERLLG